MPDFVIVIATLATLASPVPGADGPAAARNAQSGAPTVGFRTYPDVSACERAAAGLAVPPGCRLVCLPVEPMLESELASAH